MIPLARPTIPPPIAIIITIQPFFCFATLKKWGRTDGNMCENNDHYRPGRWVGRVDQKDEEEANQRWNWNTADDFEIRDLQLCCRWVIYPSGSGMKDFLISTFFVSPQIWKWKVYLSIMKEIIIEIKLLWYHRKICLKCFCFSITTAISENV